MTTNHGNVAIFLFDSVKYFRFLIGLRYYKKGEWKKILWTTPGGGRGPNEDPHSAIRRETDEEVGITEIRDLRLIDRITSACGTSYTDLFVAYTPQQCTNREPDKFLGWAWVTPEIAEKELIQPPFINPISLEKLKQFLRFIQA
jgi:8-oxo-dGTP pyrophosphatase MutT (NUDIX family)